MDFIVDRRTWYRGKGKEDSCLLRNDGMMCCLGQIGQQCGIADEDLLGALTPMEVDGCKFPDNFFAGGSGQQWIFEAMITNDKEKISDSQREAKLIQLFRENGHSIRFQN